MKSFFLAVPLLLAASSIGSASAANDASAAPPAAAPAASPEVRSIAEDNRALGVDLYRELASTSGNLFISPVSIAGAFGPVAAGARGETRSALGKALHFPADEQRLHRSLGAMLKELETETEGVSVSIANGLWLRRGLKVSPSFLAMARQSYEAEVESLDFGDPEAAALRINSWVSRETKTRIPTLLEPGVLDSNTAVVVTNAVHFLGDWAEPFLGGLTRRMPFHLDGGTTRQVPMMYGIRNHRYAETKDVQLIELPYKSDRLSMVAVLPKARGGLAAVEAKLSDEVLGGWLKQVESAELRPLHLYLPKVEIEGSYELVEPLKAMGMGIAFGSGADFSGIGPRGLFITDVIHKTFLKMDEKGTEATAATAVVMGESSGPETIFQADHPFMILIRDKQTGAVLFMGRIAQP